MLTAPEPLPPLRRMKALGKWLNDLRNYVASLHPMPSHNVQVRRTAIGTSYVGVAETTSPPVSGMVYRGDWDATIAYVRNDVVTIRGGISAGTYICVLDAPVNTPPNDPTLGIYWVSLARGNTLGQWA